MDIPTSTDLIAPNTALLLRVSEAARLLGFSRATLYKMIARGDITVVRYHTTTRVPAAEIARWIEDHTVPHTEKSVGSNVMSLEHLSAEA
jgi:excisionase family DNA binding protein